MNGNVDDKSVPAQSDLGHEVAAQAQRKIKARRNPTPGVWFGMGMMGLIGWSITVPTLLGIALGLWLDRHLTDTHFWTLALMMAGLTLGCFNAWHWVAREHTAMSGDETASSADKTAMSNESENLDENGVKKHDQ